MEVSFGSLLHASVFSGNESRDALGEMMLIGFTVAVAIFILSSLRNCVIYGVRNREYRAISRALWRSIKSRCRINAQANYRFNLTSRIKRRKTVTNVTSSNPCKTEVH